MSFKPRLYGPEGRLLSADELVIHPELKGKVALLLRAAMAVRRNVSIALTAEPEKHGIIDLSPEARDEGSLTAQFKPRKTASDKHAWRDTFITQVHKVTGFSAPLGIYDATSGERRFRKMAHYAGDREKMLRGLKMDQRFLELCAEEGGLNGIVPRPFEWQHYSLIDMEYIPGITLRKYINALLESYVIARGIDSFPEKSDHFMHAICSALAQFADNLGYLHDAGFVHNDAKLSNVVVADAAGHTHYREFVDSASETSRSVIVDLASMTRVNDHGSNEMIYRVIIEGGVFGTMTYMPIETIRFENLVLATPYRDLRAVVIALSHTLVSMMEGHTEYDGARDIVCVGEIGGVWRGFFSRTKALEYLEKNLPNEGKWRDVLDFIKYVLLGDVDDLSGHAMAERLEALASDFTPELDRSSLSVPEGFAAMEPPSPSEGGGDTDT